MHAKVTDLLGDDPKKHDAARAALVKAKGAAADALVDGLSSPRPSARETIVDVATAIGEPTLTRVLRAAAAADHRASLLRLLERKTTDDLLFVLRLPVLPGAMSWLAKERAAELGTAIAAYAAAWSACRDEVHARRAGATGDFAAFLDEIERRAGGAPAAWPKGSKRR
ncbi:MAG TPA: hypothetical protein VG389_24230 [Myxococcota bacterium]|jgi:hypothetical protein|nr:hypothetical protein [Myxococcota bacterium]